MLSFSVDSDSIPNRDCDEQIPKNKKEMNENSYVKPRKLVFDNVERKRRKISN